MYVIGDVHGCYDTLCALIEQFPNKYDEEICFVGDLIDKGPRSKEVIDLIIKYNYKAVKGNHESGFLYESKEIIKDLDNNVFNPYNTEWYRNLGGKNTIDSYGHFYNNKNKELFLEHFNFIKDLPLYLDYYGIIKNKTLVISHGYIGAIWDKRSLIKSPNQEKRFEEFILWNKDVNLINKNIFNVFGQLKNDSNVKSKDYVNLDVNKDLSKLMAIQIPSLKMFEQELLDVIR